MAALPGHAGPCQGTGAVLRRTFGRNRPAAVTDRAALAKLPVLRKSDLMAIQKSAPPLGDMTTVAPGAYSMSLSPWADDPEGVGGDPWRYARALYAAGMRPGDLVHNCFPIIRCRPA